MHNWCLESYYLKIKNQSSLQFNFKSYSQDFSHLQISEQKYVLKEMTTEQSPGMTLTAFI